MTNAERMLWSKLRRKQVLGIQFYRQKPIGNYIVDFYAPSAKLVVEVDGSQHLEPDHVEQDRRRDRYLAKLGRYYDSITWEYSKSLMLWWRSSSIH